MKVVKKLSAAVEFLRQAIESHESALSMAHQVKMKAIHSGWFFIQAKLAVDHGNFADFLVDQGCKVSERTVRSYMAFTENAIVSVIAHQNDLSDAEIRALELTDEQLSDRELFKLAQDVVLHSAQPFVALGRELALFRKFGEYDAVKHSINQARKAAGGEQRQIEFDWTLASAGLQSISALRRATPDKLPPRDKLAEMEATLSEALQTVREQLATLTAIDVANVEDASDLTPSVEPTSRTTAIPLSAEA
jgi:hypothetical protein